jgi:hypothetical protein
MRPLMTAIFGAKIGNSPATAWIATARTIFSSSRLIAALRSAAGIEVCPKSHTKPPDI